MNAAGQIAYAKEFMEIYFSFTQEQKGKREAACLKHQFTHCFMPPEKDEMLMGKYEHPCIGFGMQDAGMGYFLDEGVLGAVCAQHPELRDEVSAIREKFLPETGKAQLVSATPAHILKDMPSDNFEGESNIGFWLCRMSSTQLDFDKLLQLGIPGLREQVSEHLSREKDEEKQAFYQGLLAMMDAFCAVAHACAAKAETSGAAYGRQIAANLHKVADAKPETFWEAVQMMYLYAVMSGTYNFGRLDEYLGDFYCEDLKNQTLTHEKAVAILCSLWRLINHRKTTWDARVFVGGKGRRNEEAANEVALLAMEVAGIVKDVLPQFSLRFYEGQDMRLLDKAYENIGTGCVFPILYNDDVNIPSVQKAFDVPEEEAEQYMPFGCGEYIFYHRSVGTPSDIINLLKSLEITLFNGYDHVSGKEMGLKLGAFSEYPDFESFFAAYCRQTEHYVELQAEQESLEYRVAAEHSPFLMASLLYDDCIARGRAIYDGGARYLGGTFETYGNTNTADSLTAIKKLVFEEKRIAPETLLDMLKANFEGYEAERKMLLEAPKYGNDLEEADEMAVRVHEHICLTTRKQAQRVGLHSFLVVVINNSANTTLGHFTMASADGRPAYQHMANANNPTGGCDRNGLTAMLNSLVKMRTDIHAGSAQNIKFSRDMFSKHYTKTRMLLDTYFENGGAQLMINVLGRQDLENALKEPEKYQNLIVRVGGFCARFVELSADVQGEILSRTMY